MKSIFKLFACLSVLLGSSVAQAALIYDNGSYTSNIGGYCSSCGDAGVYTMFDDFVLDNAYSALIIEWDASFFHADDTQIQLGLWSNHNSGLLHSFLFDFNDNLSAVTNLSDIVGKNITVSFLLTGLNLTAGNYWASFSGDDMHFGSDGGNGSQIHSSQLNSGTGGGNGLLIPFRVYSANAPAQVPAPAGIFMLGLGLLALRRFGRRS